MSETLVQIGQAVGLSSTSSVAHQLMALERKGFLRRDPHRPRAYEVRGSDQSSSVQPTDTAGKPAASYVPLVGRTAGVRVRDAAGLEVARRGSPRRPDRRSTVPSARFPRARLAPVAVSGGAGCCCGSRVSRTPDGCRRRPVGTGSARSSIGPSLLVRQAGVVLSQRCGHRRRRGHVVELGAGHRMDGQQRHGAFRSDGANASRRERRIRCRAVSVRSLSTLSAGSRRGSRALKSPRATGPG